jgi:hypothetical protein
MLAKVRAAGLSELGLFLQRRAEREKGRHKRYVGRRGRVGEWERESVRDQSRSDSNGRDGRPSC